MNQIIRLKVKIVRGLTSQILFLGIWLQHESQIGYIVSEGETLDKKWEFFRAYLDTVKGLNFNLTRYFSLTDSKLRIHNLIHLPFS